MAPIEATQGEGKAVTQDINVVALVKGKERYIFLYDDTQRAETLRTLGRFASDPELSFSWYDAAVLSQKVRRTAQQQEAEEVQQAADKEQPFRAALRSLIALPSA